MQYIFILGHNPRLSVAEIFAVLPRAKKIEETGSFLIIENDEISCSEILGRLGGTIKIGKVVDKQISRKITVEKLKELKKENKLKFGISYYDCMPDNLGMETKKELKEFGISCRLITGKNKALSSVIVSKNKCFEFLVLGNRWLAETCCVQEFEEYSHRDYGRPVRDMLSGSMPPKLAKIMINLAELPSGATILDPFCGSGTVLQEGILLGYKMIGSDVSDKAIRDSEKNLEWFINSYKLKACLPVGRAHSYKLIKSDVKEISKKISGVDAIVTEPYLGPPLKGNEKLKEVEKIIGQLSELYDAAFCEFRKILSPAGKIVIVLPAFRVGKNILELPILSRIMKIGFSQVNKDKLVYSRPGQKVWRQIFVFTFQP